MSIEAAWRPLAMGLMSALLSVSAMAQAAQESDDRSQPNRKTQDVAAFWTQERLDSAISRDLFIDHSGLGYIRDAQGGFKPHGHTTKYVLKRNAVVAAERESRDRPNPRRRPRDVVAPIIEDLSPAHDASIGTSHVFSAKVTDAESGVDTVTFQFTYPGGDEAIDGVFVGDDIWEVSVSGLPVGATTWFVGATDAARPRANYAASDPQTFFVEDEGGGGEPEATGHEHWTGGGDVQFASGRLVFQMPTSSQRTAWTTYVCSGTAVSDETTDRSIILTAAHCVYEDDHKGFARNVMFIPNQDQTTGSGTDYDCDNDPIGCWVPSFGVVHDDWASRVFPSNVPSDYGFYVVDDIGAHLGASSASDALDQSVSALDMSFEPLVTDPDDPLYPGPTFTHAFGYSYSGYDPDLMYCADTLGADPNDPVNPRWIPACDLQGGASGGPWLQRFDVDAGRGEVYSVNSFRYTDAIGMGGPDLSFHIPFHRAPAAECVFDKAKSTLFNEVLDQDGEQGVIMTEIECGWF